MRLRTAGTFSTPTAASNRRGRRDCGELAKGARVAKRRRIPDLGRSELPKGMHTVDDLSYFISIFSTSSISPASRWSAYRWAPGCCRDRGEICGTDVASRHGQCRRHQGRRSRGSDIADIFALTDQEYLDIAYCDPNAGRRDYKALPTGEFWRRRAPLEATARFAWSPYFHNPRLKSRLHRVRIPALFLWGSHDRMLSEAYGRAYCAAVPVRVSEMIDRAGHFPHQEQPKAFAERILAAGGK